MNKKFDNMKKVRNKITKDVYYTSEYLPSKEINGVLFVSVKRNATDTNSFFMRKDSLEICK